MPPEWTHTPVLLTEAITALVGEPEGIYLDGTFGRGGHCRALLARLGPGARVIAFDKDPEAIAAGSDLAASDPRLTLVHASFAELGEPLTALGIGRLDGVLLDLGVSSPQIDDPSRGFSFRADGPLDMRMDTTRGETAADFLSRADIRQIAEVLREYGDERFALPIAKALVARREGGSPVRRTVELSQIVARAVKTREPGQDPATRTFQALRILVNAELEDLEQGLSALPDRLLPGARLVVISFHSLEDRIVKRFIVRESRSVYDRRDPFAPEPRLRLEALARVRPGEAEIEANPRARSAVMRVARRLPEPGFDAPRAAA